MSLGASDLSPAASHSAEARRAFMRIMAITLAVKVWLAATFPLTGDEAFFYQWGLHPDWGYSDHPPMVGWMLYVLTRISSHPLVIRSVTVLLWAVIALGLVDLLRRMSPDHEEAAYWLGCVFLLLPFTWALNIVTTDTPLVLFVFGSGYAFLRAGLEADNSRRLLWYGLSGVLLALALLSKYFAGLLAIAYFLYLIRHRNTWVVLALIVLLSLPAAFIQLAFNAHHCWSNVMFNFINRNEDAHWSLRTVALYGVMMVYLITPWIVLQVLRARKRIQEFGAVTILFLVPFSVFLVLSMKKTIGLHWVLGFMPFVFLFSGLTAGSAELRKAVRWTAWFAVPHLCLLAAVILLPASAWKGMEFHKDVVFHKETGAITAALRIDLADDATLMATAYTPAALLSYHAETYVPVFGPGKYHSRQDDLLVDFREYADRPIRIFDRRPIDEGAVAPYFESVRSRSFEVAGVKYWVMDGRNFNYAVYRERVLRQVAALYYRIPAFLPTYSCPFLRRYDLEAR